ncbi:hypothetical protein [Paenibacillus sp. PDC88]|uniref:hypothetical protein n=1 Tax=Paenibacillus sp. PDC88 TaxID=1884375 RepID=UPI0008964694|nr:hypothetical protein [Paenibacillus sp. PDC88]SDX05418.1 hypothetical protein SAMN05518848_104212 [Paenibacillus sp. PDC88]
MEETANHSGVEEVTEVPEVIETNETPIEGSDSPPQEETPRGINVKYNKEERFVPEDEVPTWVQKGLNYDKVSEKAQQAERYQQNLDRIAKFYGYDSHDSYLEALEQAEQDRRIQEEAQKLGVDEEVIRTHLQPMQEKLSKYEKEMQTIREQENLRMVESQIQTLSAKYPDFGKHQNAIIQMSIDKGYDLEDAYILTTHQERLNAAKQEAQRETLKNIQRNADSSTGFLGEDAPDQDGSYASMSAADRKAFRERVKRGEL